MGRTPPLGFGKATSPAPAKTGATKSGARPWANKLTTAQSCANKASLPPTGQASRKCCTRKPEGPGAVSAGNFRRQRANNSIGQSQAGLVSLRGFGRLVGGLSGGEPSGHRWWQPWVGKGLVTANPYNPCGQTPPWQAQWPTLSVVPRRGGCRFWSKAAGGTATRGAAPLLASGAGGPKCKQPRLPPRPGEQRTA